MRAETGLKADIKLPWREDTWVLALRHQTPEFPLPWHALRVARINSYTCARACRLRKEKRRKEEEAEEKKGGEKMVENEMDKSADENRDVGTNGRWWGAAPTC